MGFIEKYTCKFVLLGAAAVFVCRYLSSMNGAIESFDNIRKYVNEFAETNFVKSTKTFYNNNKKSCLAFYGSTALLGFSGYYFDGSKPSCTLGLLSFASTIYTFSILKQAFPQEASI